MLASELAAQTSMITKVMEIHDHVGNFLNASVIVLHKCETKGDSMFRS